MKISLADALLTMLYIVIATHTTEAIPIFPHYVNKDTTNGIILNEVKVYSGKSIYLETEKPKKINGIMPLSTGDELVVFFQEEFLSNKHIRSLSIYFTKKVKNHIIQVKFYSIGRELIPNKPMEEGVSLQNPLSQLKLFTLIPDKILHEKEIIIRLEKAGWKEYILPIDNFKIPENGIAVVLKMISKTSKNNNGFDLPGIRYGKYSIPKITKVKWIGNLKWVNQHEDRDFDKEYGDYYKYDKKEKKNKELFNEIHDGTHAVMARIKVYK
jgi:hypothetical protein